jgi:hypothetical protein
MIIDIQSLEDVRFQFVELGRAVSDLSKDIKGSVQNVQDSLSKLQRSLDKSIDSKAVNEISEASADISKITGEYSQAFEEFEMVFDGFDGFGDSLRAASEKFGELSSDVDKISNQAAAETARAAPTVVGTPRKKDKGLGSRKPGLIGKEVKSAKGQLRGLLSKLKVPAKGAVAAGAIAWMVYGFQEKDRMRAEAGEAFNIMVTAFDGMSKDMVRKGTKYVSGFQEKMQKFFGIAKSEVQEVERSFVEGGIPITEMLKGLEKDMGMVGENYMSYSLAVDKMYNMAGGTTAKKMVKYAEDYGKSMEEAKNSIDKIMSLGQESGLGTQYFVDMVEKSGESLKKLGFDLDTVADLAVAMQEKFEAIGVPKKFAGRQIALGLDQMASGLANMSEGWQSLIAEKMGYGEGIEGMQRFKEASTRVSEGRNVEELENFIVTTVNTVKDMVRGDEARTRYILKGDIGMGFEGAKIAYMITEAVNAGDKLKARKLSKDYKKQIKDAFKTERKKTSEFQLNMNKWMKGLSDIGQGMLGLLGSFLNTFIATIKSIPAMFMNIFDKDGAKNNERLAREIGEFAKNNNKYKKLVSKGFGRLKEAGLAMGEDILGDMFDDTQKAFEFDASKFTGGVQSPTMAEPSRGSSVMGTKAPELPPSVQLVPIPMSQPGVYGVKGVPEETYASPMAEFSAWAQDEDWVGGELNIVSQGVDENGDISVGLVGNCPKCGLEFGEGFDREEYEAALEGPGEKSEFIFPNLTKPGAKPKRAAFDIGTEQGLAEFARLARGKSSRKAGVAGTLDPKLGGILKQVSERYPGKGIKVFSGQREGEKGVHGKGQALDIGVEGVPSKDLFRFLRSNVKGGGKGFYPKQSFVHVDVRPGRAVWVDQSKRGESSKGKVIGGAKANEWLNKNVGWESGSETKERYAAAPSNQSSEADFAPEQTRAE